MDSGLKTISSLFDGAKKLVIPIYQRNYAWEKPQWKDFWEDVYYQSANQKYFFGTILLKESQREGDFEVLEIVDGQQRLTTATIFIYLLLEYIKKINDQRDLKLKQDKYIEYYDIHKLKISDLDNEFFQTYIIKENDTEVIYNSPSQRRLFEAKKYFEDMIRGKAEKELDKMLSMIENSEILVYSVKNSAEATLIFETSNDRGKELTSLEKLKSYLMYRSFLSAGENASDLIDRIHLRFGEIYRALERIKPIFGKRRIIEVTEDQICQYHFVGECAWSNKSQYQDYLGTLKDHLNNLGYHGEHDRIVKYIETYSNSLKETFLTLETILNLENRNLDDIVYIGKIAIFFPLLIVTYKYDRTEDKRQFTRILQTLEKFSARLYALNMYRVKDMAFTLNKITRDFYWDKNFKSVEKALIDNIEYRSSKVNQALSQPNLYHLLGGQSLSYLFWKYENFLRTNFQPVSGEMSYQEFNDKTGKYRISIEHITSQTPLNELVFAERTEEFEQNFLHSLGNLTISPQSSNSSMGNDIWENKNTYYFQKAPFKTQLELSGFVDPEKKKWDDITINKRRGKIIEFAINRWATEKEKREI